MVEIKKVEVEVVADFCEDCGRLRADCPGTRRRLMETCFGVEEVVEYCDGLMERC